MPGVDELRSAAVNGKYAHDLLTMPACLDNPWDKGYNT